MRASENIQLQREIDFPVVFVGVSGVGLAPAKY
jgi:hypothetical protein